MQRRKRRGQPGHFLIIGACTLSFVAGAGTAWWVTDTNAVPPTAQPTTSGDTGQPADPAPSTITPPAPTEPLDLPPPLPPDDDPFDAQLTRDDIVKTGSGKFAIAPGTSKPTGKATDGSLQRYRVEVENDLPLDPAAIAETVEEILADERGWTAQNEHQFQRVSDDSFDFRVLIATPDTVDKLCAPLKTKGEVSCGRAGRATLNAVRWVEGVESYGDDVDNYRRYLVNHEIGHLLGYAHAKCPGEKQPSPVMVQQTYSTQGCKPNPWPHPN